MKKILITITMLFCLFLTINVIVESQSVVPIYGVTPSGRIYFREDIADKLCSAGQTMDVSGNWTGKNSWVPWTSMALQDYNGTGVYVFDSGLRMKGTKTLCFRISTDCYFPSVAVGKSEYFVNTSDVVSNGKTGQDEGYNLQVEVGDFDF